MLIAPFRLLLPDHLNALRLAGSEEALQRPRCARMLNIRGKEGEREDEEFEVKRL